MRMIMKLIRIFGITLFLVLSCALTAGCVSSDEEADLSPTISPTTTPTPQVSPSPNDPIIGTFVAMTEDSNGSIKELLILHFRPDGTMDYFSVNLDMIVEYLNFHEPWKNIGENKYDVGAARMELTKDKTTLSLTLDDKTISFTRDLDFTIEPLFGAWGCDYGYGYRKYYEFKFDGSCFVTVEDEEKISRFSLYWYKVDENHYQLGSGSVYNFYLSHDGTQFTEIARYDNGENRESVFVRIPHSIIPDTTEYFE